MTDLRGCPQTATGSATRQMTEKIIMALKQTAPPAATFESEEGTDNNEVDSTVDSPAAETVQPTTAVVVPTKTRALSTGLTGASAVMSKNVLSGLKDAFTVDFDSVPNIVASQGSFSFKDTEQELGSKFVLQLLSYQDSYVASPNDNKAPVDLVKYSEDGVTSKDGVNLLQHVADLKEQGYSKSKITHRVVLVGELVSAAIAGVDHVQDLVQISLPETGRKSFNTFTLQASYAVAKGRRSVEEVGQLTMTAVKDKTKNGEIYTKVVIS